MNTSLDHVSSPMQIVKLCADYVEMRQESAPSDPKRLSGLDALFREPSSAGAQHERRTYARAEVDLPVDLLVHDGRRSARLVDIGGGGMRISVDDTVPPSWEWITVVASDTDGVDYAFRCDVRWRRGAFAGLSFFGKPVRITRMPDFV